MKKITTNVTSVRTALLAAAAATLLASCGGSGKYKAGTYTGTAEGRNGEVEVTVKLSSSKITSISVTKHEETPGISDAAIKDIPAAIVKAQSTNVDAISGATITSDAIIQATRAALASAGVTEAGGPAAARKNAGLTYKAGTYSGKAQGMNGPVVLDVTFSDSAITDIKVASSRETAHVGDPAYPIMFKDAIEANGSGIDVVSGATFTALAVKN
ncbi:MAG: FMN-binding protein, partial [Treponema sp.]|nr:FMN-binding protein [Treponema sp.]